MKLIEENKLPESFTGEKGGKDSGEKMIEEKVNNIFQEYRLKLESVKDKESMKSLLDCLKEEIETILPYDRNSLEVGDSEMLSNLILFYDKIKFDRFEWYFNSFSKIKNKEEKSEKVEKLVDKAFEEDETIKENIKPEMLKMFYKDLIDKIVEIGCYKKG